MYHDRIQESYLAAYHFAARAHGAQVYPGTEISYIMHLSFVSMEVLAALAAEPGHDGVLAVQCAVLHDVLEDTPTSAQDVEAMFGPRVLAGVQALTKAADVPKAAAMADSLRRIQAQPDEVWMVKLADRVSNLQEPPAYWTAPKCLAYQAEARLILDALAPASPYLAARLAQKIEAYGRWCVEG